MSYGCGIWLALSKLPTYSLSLCGQGVPDPAQPTEGLFAFLIFKKTHTPADALKEAYRQVNLTPA